MKCCWIELRRPVSGSADGAPSVVPRPRIVTVVFGFQVILVAAQAKNRCREVSGNESRRLQLV